ncbi:hypothetical protein I5677_01875 [Mobilitalea sibirica]|uniref:Uncharacterized protein n=1 Tax=Mobilitalea sibirica TaxID=1462919 RepID=A0A8J7GX53_9FIRM|nr:hypothetical protein [Mobilitalea sibirica]MBH1939639.1 hypothetical protein [Mobilitalea sibirica]
MSKTSEKPDMKFSPNKGKNSKNDTSTSKTENKTVKSSEVTVDIDINLTRKKSDEFWDFEPKKLQEAIVWSEILEKPVCRRRKRRYYVN